ncbi:MAG: hypothetical protein ACXVAX_04845 [Pseudobdellovibrio sp.]
MSLFETDSKSYYLSLYIIASPFGIDWTSPRSLLLSNLRNQLFGKSRKLGHINVRLSGPGQEEVLTGMVSTHLDTKTQLLKNGIGFGIFWHSFQGRLESQQPLKAELPTYIYERRISQIRIKISETQHRKLTQYLEEYKKVGADKKYGLYHNPLKKEGAGCTAFAMSFLKVAGVLDSERTSWMQKVNVPENLIGRPFFERYVFLFKILLYGRWAGYGQIHKSISFWDPDIIHSWVQTTFLHIKRNPNDEHKFFAREINGVRTLEVDESQNLDGLAFSWLEYER